MQRYCTWVTPSGKKNSDRCLFRVKTSLLLSADVQATYVYEMPTEETYVWKGGHSLAQITTEYLVYSQRLLHLTIRAGVVVGPVECQVPQWMRWCRCQNGKGLLSYAYYRTKPRRTPDKQICDLLQSSRTAERRLSFLSPDKCWAMTTSKKMCRYKQCVDINSVSI